MTAPALPRPADPISPDELAGLIRSFSDATTRLHQTHEALRRRVESLQAELREKNQQLARSERLAALGQMATGIAHEVRNPLGSIRLYAQMLEHDLADRPEQQRIAAKIAGAVRGLDGVVGDVLAFARELRVRPIDLDAGALLERAAEACCIAHGTVRVHVVTPAAEVRCDPDLAHQALVNLIRNALQAMAESSPPPQGHSLTLESAVAPDGMVALRVRDTGPGVSDEVIARMFNPFFTTRAAGTGLGLPIVHRIADAHGGRAAVRNNPDRGATAELVLPAPRRTEAPAQAQEAAHESDPGRR